MSKQIRKGEQTFVGGEATHVLFNFPGYGAMYMGSLISLSYQTYRDKTPVFNLGNTNVDGFAIGKRYVAGSIIKVLLLDDDIRQFLQKVSNDIGLKIREDIVLQRKFEKTKSYHHLLTDDIISFDIIIVMSSEYGKFSVGEIIYGATLINSGQVHSIQDLITENTISFVARDVRQTHDEIGSSRVSGLHVPERRGSSLSEKVKTQDDYKKIEEKKWWEDKLELARTYAAADSEITDEETVIINTLSTLAGQWTGDKPYADFNYDAIPQIWRYDGKTTPGGQNGSIATQNGENHPYITPSIKRDGGTWLDIAKESFYTNNDTSLVDDGDTLVVKDVFATNNQELSDGLKERLLNSNGVSLRFLGIDAPETKKYNPDGSVKSEGQPYGDEATEFMKAYVKDGRWDRDAADGRIKPAGIDDYGRLLVYNPGYIIAAARAGLVHVNISSIKRAGGTQEEINAIYNAEQLAKSEQIGMWSGTHKIEDPYLFRKRTKKNGEKNAPAPVPKAPLPVGVSIAGSANR